MIKIKSENIKFYSFDINTETYADLHFLPWETAAFVGDKGKNVIEMRAVGPGWPAAISWYQGGLICSEPLCREMESLGMKVGARYDLKIVSAEEGCKKKKPPTYFYYRIRRGMMLDRNYYKWPDAIQQDNWAAYRRVPIPETHNGDDVFMIEGEIWNSMFCTRRFFEAACHRKWKVFAFQAMDLPAYRPTYQHRYVPGRDSQPCQWYPAGIAAHPSNLGEMPQGVVVPENEMAAATGEAETVRADRGTAEALPDSPSGEEEDPTGYLLLGEPIRWQHENPDWTREEREAVRRLILAHLDAAIPLAEAYLRRRHDEAGEEEPVEVWDVGVALAEEQPEGEADFHWEMNIEAHHAGACPGHYLTFRNENLVEATGAD